MSSMASRLGCLVVNIALARSAREPAPRSADALLDGLVRAQRYAACRKSPEAFRRLQWLSRSVDGNGTRLKDVQGAKVFAAFVATPRVEERRAVYARNPKVVSEWFMHLDLHGLAHGGPGRVEWAWSAFTNHEGEPTSMPRKFDANRLRCAPGDVAFTFVREPSRTFLSGLAQAACTLRRGDREAAPEPRGTWLDAAYPPFGDGARLVEAYLDDMDAGRSIHPKSEHTWPQAHKVDFVRRAGCGDFAFIGTMETLEASFVALFPRATLPLPPATHTAGEDECKRNLTASIGGLAARPDLQRRVCAAVAVDYDCFDYELPPACR
ncbi:voltage-gated chloride channel [Aureococcus anophagefferens]|nr:voltage-gated chloride channel [Aureococcus anophagefferens]